jgi:molybdenum cofactor biosynthesis protein B
MPSLNENLAFKPLRIAILTISDTRDLQSDTSGQLLLERATAAGHEVVRRDIVTDDAPEISAIVSKWIEDPQIEIILTTGGTGFTKRDVTPEALAPLFEKTIDGFSVIFHKVSYDTVGLSTLKSRACAGLAKDTFIFCLPGSNGAVKDGWDHILKSQLDIRYKPCNFAELIPRLEEI